MNGVYSLSLTVEYCIHGCSSTTFCVTLPCDFTVFPLKRQSAFPHPLLSWPYDLLWPTAWGRSDRVPVLSLGLKSPHMPACPLALLPSPRECPLASLMVQERWHTWSKASPAEPNLNQCTLQLDCKYMSSNKGHGVWRHQVLGVVCYTTVLWQNLTDTSLKHIE